MSKINMKLNAQDEQKINALKQRYGFEQTSELIRYLLTNTMEELRKERLQNRPITVPNTT